MVFTPKQFVQIKTLIPEGKIPEKINVTISINYTEYGRNPYRGGMDIIMVLKSGEAITLYRKK